MTVKTETLTANQVARRGRVLDAALELAAEGGYDAVQMRDVAARAQVALGTIYRYFSSKDHLLAACQVELWRAQADRLVDRPPEGSGPAERVVQVMERRDAGGGARAEAHRGAHHGVVVAGSRRPRLPGRDHVDHGPGARERDGRGGAGPARADRARRCARCGSRGCSAG